jgi:hypothetical protein
MAGAAGAAADFFEFAINIKNWKQGNCGYIELAAGSDRLFISRLPGENASRQSSEVMAC